MADSPNSAMLAPPAVVALKEDAVGTKDSGYRGAMERTVSMDIREERDDLKRAAEQSLNAIMDLNLDGSIRWASPSWKDLSGVDPESIVGKTMSDIIVDHKNIFTDAIALMRNDDTKSRIIRFAITYQLPVGASPRVTLESPHAEPVAFIVEDEDSHEHLVNLEAQGIMVYERATGEESHV
jgi:serine/threonine-protein kinase RIM15